MRIDIARAAELLRENDDILVLCHAHPDGDTLGCGYALMHMLQSLGKRCRLECADEIAPKYSFMAEGLASITTARTPNTRRSSALTPPPRLARRYSARSPTSSESG